MTVNVSNAVRDLELHLGDNSALAQAIEHEQHAETSSQALALISSGAPNAIDLAVVRLLARAATMDATDLDPPTASLAGAWLCRTDVAASLEKPIYFGAVIGGGNPRDLEAVLETMLGAQSDPTSNVFTVSGFLAIQRRESLLERLARHPRDDVRHHFFALLGKHQRLVPPGSLHVHDLSKEALLRLLRLGISDAIPKVRERAIAAAYGLGVVDGVRDDVLAHVSDESIDVRQYSIVALGVLADAESRSVLLRLLQAGSEPEAASAIWALARRADGIAHVLALAGDPRDWVNEELLGAVAEVASPLSDEQILSLSQHTKSPEWPRLRQRHLDRTRHGAPELGPDGRIEYVLRRS